MDRVVIEGLLLQGVVGINPEERETRQDIRVDVTMWVDTRPAAKSDDIADAVNYRTVAKAIISHVTQGSPMLVERLAAEIAGICLATDERIGEVEVAVRKPGAVRFADDVGVIIRRSRSS